MRKIERVVQAVPRMEGFISNLCREMTMSEDRVAQLPLEQMIPRLQIWKQIVEQTQTSLAPLIGLKQNLTCLLVEAD